MIKQNKNFENNHSLTPEKQKEKIDDIHINIIRFFLGIKNVVVDERYIKFENKLVIGKTTKL